MTNALAGKWFITRWLQGRVIHFGQIIDEVGPGLFLVNQINPSVPRDVLFERHGKLRIVSLAAIAAFCELPVNADPPVSIAADFGAGDVPVRWYLFENESRCREILGEWFDRANKPAAAGKRTRPTKQGR